MVTVVVWGREKELILLGNRFFRNLILIRIEKLIMSRLVCYQIKDMEEWLSLLTRIQNRSYLHLIINLKVCLVKDRYHLKIKN